jgi:hypothetical protein
MRHLMLAAAVSGAALMAGYGTAAAQVAIEIPGAGVYVGPGYDDGYYSEYGGRRTYGYRSYRYYDDAYDTRARERHLDRGRCGRNAFWNGEACVAGRRP